MEIDVMMNPIWVHQIGFDNLTISKDWVYH